MSTPRPSDSTSEVFVGNSFTAHNTNFDQYRLSGPIVPTQNDASLVAFVGNGDVTILMDNNAGGVQNHARTELTAGQQQFEQEARQNGFTKNNDGSYSISLEDRPYRVEYENGAPNRVFISKAGKEYEVTDETRRSMVISRVMELKAKMEASEMIRRNPLDAQQQQAFDQISSLLQNHNWQDRPRLTTEEQRTLNGVAQQFNNDPGRLTLVWQHLNAERFLRGINDGISFPHSSTNWFQIFRQGESGGTGPAQWQMQLTAPR